MATKTLEEFLQSRLRAYDPTIDLSSGSPADSQVVQPIVARFNPDPFEMPVEEFIDARMAQEFPDTNVQEGTGLRDLLVKPQQVLLDPVIRELQLIKKGQSLIAPDQLADSEVDAIVANLFVDRNTGDLARGPARLFFNAPQAVRVSAGNIFYTADNLRFFPDRQQSISAENMAFNQSGSLYYFDVDVVAEQAGDAYNIDPEVNPLVGVTNISVAVRVTNLIAFSGGLATETSDELIARAEESITERSLVTPRGTSARLRAEFPALTQLQVIGYGDAEMNRDLLTGGDLGECLLFGDSGQSVDDGAGNPTTTRFGVQTGSLLPAGYSLGESGISADAPLYLLLTEMRTYTGASIAAAHLDRLLLNGHDIFSSADIGATIWILGASNGVRQAEIAEVNGGYLRLVVPGTLTSFVGVAETGLSWVFLRKTTERKIKYFVSETELVLDDSTPITFGVENDGSFGWEIRRKELTISGMPTGIVLEADRAELTTQSNQVHLGGCSDFYVRGGEADQDSKVLESLEDENPVFRGTDGRTLSTDPSFFWDRPEPSRADDSFGSSLPTSVNFVLLNVEPGDSLVVEAGPDAGTKTILRVGRSNSGAIGDQDYGCLQVSPPFTSTQEFLRYKIVKTVTVNLRQPTLLRASGSDGKTVQASNVFTTGSSLNFLERNVVAGDRLRVLTGVDAGEYAITKVSGAGSRNLELSGTFTNNAEALGWEIVKVQEGLRFPLLQIRSIELLDSSSQATGHLIPYGLPVDVRTTAFSNFGKGGKCFTSNAAVGIIGRTSLESADMNYPLSAANLTVAVNGSRVFIDLTGATDKNNIVTKINALLPNNPARLVKDSLLRDRLWLRSDTNWLQVVACYPSSGTQWIGLQGTDGTTLGDDNRQIRCDTSGFSWTDPSTWSEVPEGDRRALDAELDCVEIQGVETATNFYLKRVSSDRLFVVSFAEDEKIVRFPVPQVGATVQIGTRSLGSARIYFKDPTSMEVLGKYRPSLQSTGSHRANLAAVRDGFNDPESIVEDEPEVTYFYATVNGTRLRFIPDPALSRVLIPDPTSDVPNNLCSSPDYGGYALVSDPTQGGAAQSRSAQINFLSRRVRAGDSVEITYAPILGAIPITPASLPGKDMHIRIAGGAAKRLLFTDQVTDVASALAQINDFVGSEIAFLDDVGNIRLEADFSIELVDRSLDDPTFAAWALPYLGLLSSPRTNRAINAGTYTIKSTGKTHELDLGQAVILADDDLGGITTEWTGQHFIVRREGSQRVHVTAMEAQVEGGLYYMDVQLLSDGFGDVYNLPEDTILAIEGYASDGYHFEVENPNLSFSTEEQVNLVFSRQVLLSGETDDLGNAVSIVGQNVQINYDYSSLTEAIQLFVGSELDRVTTASLLVRHLLPNYLYFELVYQGGSSSEVVQKEVDEYLAGLGPSDSVQASSLQQLAGRKGAYFVQSPLTLVALGVDASRNMSVVRSSNMVSHGRLSTFFPGSVVVTQL